MLAAMLQVQREHFSELESPAYVLAQTYAGLGDWPHAIRHLTASIARHEPDAVSLNIDPLFTSLRHRAEFRQLVQRAGVAPNAN